MQPNPTCQLCGNNSLKVKYSTSQYDILVCENCSLFVKNEKLKPRAKHYGDDYYTAYPYSNLFSLNRRYFEAKLRIICRLIGKSHPSILDIGAGWGDFGEVARGVGLPYFATDLSPAAQKILKAKKLPLLQGSLTDIIAQKKQFDAIVSFQTIEHIATPVTFLQKARRLLTKNGIILLTTPNNLTPLRFLARGEWSVYNIESHYIFYDVKTLHLLLEKAGFKNIKVRLDPPRFFSLGYVLNRLDQSADTRFEASLGFSRRVKRAKNAVSGLLNIPLPTDPWGDLEVIGHKVT